MASSAGGIAGSLIRANAAKRAAGQQSSGLLDAADLLEDVRSQGRSDVEPQIRLGQLASGLLGELLGLGPQSVEVSNPEFAKIQRQLANTPAVIKSSVANREGDFRGETSSDPNPEFNRLTSKLARTSPTIRVEGEPSGVSIQEIFENTPGFQFIRDEADRTAARRDSATGNVFSGSALKGAEERGANLASTTFNNFLAQLGGAAQFGTNTALNQNRTAASLAGGQAGLIGDAATARASGTVARGDATASGVENFFNFLGSGVSGIGGGPGGGAPANASGVSGGSAAASATGNNAFSQRSF